MVAGREELVSVHGLMGRLRWAGGKQVGGLEGSSWGGGGSRGGILSAKGASGSADAAAQVMGSFHTLPWT